MGCGGRLRYGCLRAGENDDVEFRGCEEFLGNVFACVT